MFGVVGCENIIDREGLMASIVEYFKSMGVKIKENAYRVTTDKRISYLVPVYGSQDVDAETGRVEGSTGLLKPIRWDKIPYEPLPGEIPEGCQSHRWKYGFGHTWVFLSLSPLNSTDLIRPAYEVIQKLINVERKIKNLDDHISRMRMALLENWKNQHARNRLMHYLHDAWYMGNNLSDPKVIEKMPIFIRRNKRPLVARGDRMFYRQIGMVNEESYMDEDFLNWWRLESFKI